jgi:hypothetical protein
LAHLSFSVIINILNYNAEAFALLKSHWFTIEVIQIKYAVPGLIDEIPSSQRISGRMETTKKTPHFDVAETASLYCS